MSARAPRDGEDTAFRSARSDTTREIPVATLRLIELMHPDGHARSAGVVGSNGDSGPAGAGAATLLDVLLLAPSARRQRDHSRMLAELQRQLAPDGVVFVRPARRWRRRTAAHLRGAGFRVGPMLLQIADGAGVRFMVPLARGELSLLRRNFADRPLAGAAIRAVILLLAWTRLAAESLDVGFLAWRDGARQPLEWLGLTGISDAALAHVVAARGWRGADDSVLLHVLDERGRQRAVVKVGRPGAATTEHDMIAAAGVSARAAGVTVPAPLGTAALGLRRAVVLSAVPGVPATMVVRRDPGEAVRLLDRLGGWLENWNRATTQHQPLVRNGSDLLRPLDQVAPLLADAAPYAQALRGLAQSFAGRRLPLVAAHGDLTLFNVLVDGASIGVVDWEAATVADLPLTDLEYAAVDIAAAVGGYRDRVAAWRRCFLGADAFATRFRAARARSAALLQLPPSYVEFCHHIGWLRHAADELRSGASAERPFLDIVRELTRRGVAPHG